jgi:hypothetical protein
MPNKAAKFSSEYLPQEQIHAALLALPIVLQSLVGEHRVIAMYGCSSNLHGALLYQPMGSDTRWLEGLIEDSIDQRIIEPGSSDFLFEVPEKRLELLFCHESDIHLDGADDGLLQKFMASEPYNEMRWYTKEELSN